MQTKMGHREIGGQYVKHDPDHHELITPDQEEAWADNCDIIGTTVQELSRQYFSNARDCPMKKKIFSSFD